MFLKNIFGKLLVYIINKKKIQAIFNGNFFEHVLGTSLFLFFLPHTKKNIEKPMLKL